MDNWWAKAENEIGTMEGSELGVTMIAARKMDDGEWEYAFVRWRHHRPTLLAQMKGNKLERSAYYTEYLTNYSPRCSL